MQYEIVGGAFPVVVCHLAAGEAMKTEKGSMVWMDPALRMETSGGGVGKMLGRAFTGESVFQNVYTATAAGKIAFGSSFTGRILPIQVTPNTNFIFQKMSFLASEMGVDLSVAFSKSFGAGIFGGEGFIMQRLSGRGMAFIECDGDLVTYDLAPGQRLIVDTGNVLGYTASVTMDVQMVPGLKNYFFGGEGAFNTSLTGPGRVWLQTMPLANLMDLIEAHLHVSK